MAVTRVGYQQGTAQRGLGAGRQAAEVELLAPSRVVDSAVSVDSSTEPRILCPPLSRRAQTIISNRAAADGGEVVWIGADVEDTGNWWPLEPGSHRVHTSTAPLYVIHNGTATTLYTTTEIY